MIREATTSDVKTVAALAALLWGHHAEKELVEEFTELLVQEDTKIFLKYEKEVPAGFAQCQLRHDYVEGTKSSPVGYLEGIFVREEYRHKGFAKELLEQCEAWAKSKGCTEFASDCEIGNQTSFAFHMAMNFKEASRIICFTKQL